MPLHNIKIDRKAKLGQHRLLDIFPELDKVNCIKRLFGAKTKRIMDRLGLGVSKKEWYAWVDDKKGRVMIGQWYLRKGKSNYIYLDIIHELAHIKQHRKKIHLWDDKYHYVDRPTEIEAYRFCVKEAKRLGMRKGEIQKYLYMSWLSDDENKRLYKNSGVG